jgi:transposase
MSYDKKFREQVLKYIENGHSIREAHRVFELSTTAIMGWKKLQKETGGLEKRPLDRKSTKVCSEKLLTFLNENPDSYLRETAEVFNCTEQAIHYAMKRLKITRKKNH